MTLTTADFERENNYRCKTCSCSFRIVPKAENALEMNMANNLMQALNSLRQLTSIHHNTDSLDIGIYLKGMK